MNALKYIVCFAGVWTLSIMPSDCNFAFSTGINYPNDCDKRKQFETCDGDVFGKTFFSFRPQDSDSSRRILGWFNADYQRSIFHPGVKNVLTISPQYTRSFNPKDIATWFFFNGSDSMTVGIPSAEQAYTINGSQIGLSLGTEPYHSYEKLVSGEIGKVWAKPLVENFILDFDYWHDLSVFKKGLWMRFEAPLVYMKTKMNLCAKGKGIDIDPYPSGLMSLCDIGEEGCGTTPVPYTSILCALQGNKGWGAVAPLKFGKFPLRDQGRWGVAGLHMDLGYDFLNVGPILLAGSLQVVFPTGTRPRGIYILEPVIGANKSWQVGGTFIAHYLHEFKESTLGIHIYAVGTHLFKAKQDRVFTLKNNCAGSQLLLLKQFNAIGSELIDAEREANIFCGTARIGAQLMFDGSIMLQFSKKRFVADLGYNYWARTKEMRSHNVCFKGFYEDALGIKGDQPMETELTNIGCPGTYPVCTYDLATACATTIACPGEANETTIFIQPSDIEYGSVLSPGVMSNKIFAALGFKSQWFAILSGEAEFGKTNGVVNQWGIMIKIGREF
jgi:hypothetical protein